MNSTTDPDSAHGYTVPSFLRLHGRINRTRYALILCGIYVAIQIAGLHIGFFIVAIIGGFVAYLCAVVQRLHDVGLPGWLALVFGLPGPSLVLLAVPGTRQENRHGPRPPRAGLKEIVVLVIAGGLSIAGLVLSYVMIVVPAWERYRHAAGL